jgi:serine/threonine-protein kinase
VKVPEVVGMDLSAGMQLLEQEGLAGEVVARKASEKAAAEAILEAQPAPGRMVKLGRRILLTLSTGSDWTTAPDVRKMSVERAKGLLVSRSLRPGQEKVDFHPEVPAGYVIQQSPLPGTRLKRDSFVHLQVSKGPRPPEAGSEEPGPPAVKSGEVSLVVPPGARLQEVKIVVEDGKGEHTIYEEFHHPGEAVTCPVSGEGERVTAKVYVSGELLLEKEL